MVRLSCKRAINNVFSSRPKIKTSQFVGPEGPRDDAFLHYRLVHFCFSSNKSIEKWAAFA